MSTSASLAGKIAIVTGAGGALGMASAILLAARGAAVACIDLPGTDWSRLTSPAHAGEMMVVDADVTDEASTARYVAETVSRFGRIDVLFNNAGIEGPPNRIEDCQLADFRRVIDVNVCGVFLGLKHVLPVMYRQGSGSIINSSSVAGMVGTRGRIGYNASKHAVIGLTKVAALEAGPLGVRVNAINPGPIEGRMMQSILSTEPDPHAARSAAESLVPMGRYGTPDEVARLVAFLASDDASFCNGGNYTVDGGRHVV